MLHDVAIWRPAAPDGVGDLHRGRVTARVRAMGGCFVALDGAEGFLPESEGQASEGQMIGVRITRAAQGGKGPRLSARLSDAQTAMLGSGPPALLARGPDALARLQALHPQAEIVHDTVLHPAFPPELEEAWEALAAPHAPLPGGAVMQVHPTPALVAIDIDLGAATGARESKQRSQREANRALLPELARQIRLRNLGGAIVVDLGGMTAKERVALAPDFTRALAEDPLQPRFLGFTALGLAEILRPRIHPMLHETLAGPHAAGLAGLRQLCRTAAAQPAQALALRASADVAAALQADGFAREDVRARTGRDLLLTLDRTLPPCRCVVETA